MKNEERQAADIPTQRTLREAHLRIRERADRNPVKCDWPDGMSYREYVLLTGDRRISELANRTEIERQRKNVNNQPKGKTK